MLVAVVATYVMGKRFEPLDMVQMHRLNSLSSQTNDLGFVCGETQWSNATNTRVDRVIYGITFAGVPAYAVVDENHTGHDSSPILLRDGNIMFLSTRTGSSQIFVSSTYTDAPHYTLDNSSQLTDFPLDIDTFKVQGNTLVFTTMMYPGTTMSETAKIDKERSERWDTTQEWKKGFVRRWDAFWDGKYSHVLVVPLDKKDGIYSVDASKVVDVMGAIDGDCPSRPFGGDDEYSISPDEKLVAFTTQTGRNMPYSTDLNVYIYNRETGKRECISCHNPATDTSPIFHPDGRHLYYLAMKEPGYESDVQNVMVYDLLTKETTPFNPNNDVSWSSLHFSPDGTRLYGATADINGTQFYHIKPDGYEKIFEAQNGTFTAMAFTACPDDSDRSCPVFLIQKFDLPSEAFVLNSKNKLVQFTTLNLEALKKIEFTEATLYTYVGANNENIYGWLHKPYGFQPDKKYPLVMYIHGGPEDCWSNEFHYRWQPQMIAALGYAVFEPNPHGSNCASQGSEFTRAIRSNWGGWPYEDVMKGLDFLRENFDWIDMDKVAAMGASYGGYMMNWLNSQTNGTFRCIICHDGVFDASAMYYETDELYFMDNEFNGTPTTSDNYQKYSPSSFAANMCTPQLTIHGGIDFRISEVQAFGVFNNLQRLGVESKLIRFPTENHWVLNPSNSLFWHDEVFDWLKHYLG